ncbi:VOC family protein [Spirillospora albida]|uniref:VOC family protein n=1 Tax=Spirillospora albida TaxID=58123 RepID=UPI0004BF5AAD|nr:VOC family protein [Spirillospora albida]
MARTGITTCLWFDDQAEEAVDHYTSIFPDGRIGQVIRNTDATPGETGAVMAIEFEINGSSFMALNGGPLFTFSEAVSFQVFCDDQAEVDSYWSRLGEGGEESQCGWLKDRYGVSWQIIPTAYMEMVADPDPAKVARVLDAMMKMVKLDIAALRKAYDGD